MKAETIKQKREQSCCFKSKNWCQVLHTLCLIPTNLNVQSELLK